MVSNIDNKINIIQKTIKLVVDPPPPPIIAKADTGATAYYFTQVDAHVLVNLQPTNTGSRIQLPDNRTVVPQLFGHLPLALSHSETKTHVFQPCKMPHYCRLVSYVMMCAKPFLNKYRFKSWTVTKK